MSTRFKGTSELQRLKNAAARGITTAWDTLADVVAEDTAAFLEVLPLIYATLDAQKVPTSVDRTSTEPTKAVVLARHALECLDQGFATAEMEEVPRLEQGIERHWDDIWTWCEFFFRYFIDPDIPEEEEVYHFDISGVMSCVFHTLAQGESTRALLKATSGFPTMIASMWLYAYEFESTEIWATTGTIELLFIPVDARGKETIGVQPWAYQFIDTLMTKSSQLLGIIFKRVDFLALSSESAILCVSLRQEFAVFVECILLSPELAGTILARGFVHKVTLIMSRLASHKQRFPASEMDDATQCLCTCAHFLLIRLREGPRWIIQALEGRLLLTILRCRKFIKYDSVPGPVGPISELDDRFSDLVSVITPYVIYHPILRLVEKVIRTHESWELSPPAKGTLLLDAWNTLKDRALEERELREISLSRNLVLSDISCANVECCEAMSGKKVMRCSKCLNETFCSRECQALCWKSGHREECELTVARLEEGRVPPISRYDKASIYALSLQRFGIHCQSHSSDTLERVEGATSVSEPEVTKFDLRTPRPTITRVPLDEYRGPGYEKEIADAKEGKVLLMRVEIPNGVESVTLFGSILALA